MVNMRGTEADFASRDDPHGYVLQGAPWGSGVRPFRALYDLGLKETDDVLDFGCGSLRVGRFLIMYLDPGHYFGIEPSEWAVKEGLKREVGASLAKIKTPSFMHPDYGTFDASLFPGPQTYDWVLISGILTHMDHKQLRATLQTAASVLKPGGRIVASYLPQGPDHDYEGWLYPQQASHYPACITAALLGTSFVWQGINVPGDAATWFDAWFEARRG